MKITKELIRKLVKEAVEKDSTLEEGWKEKMAGLAAGAAMMMPGLAQAKTAKAPTKAPAVAAQKAQKPEKQQNFNVNVEHRGQQFNVAFESIGAGLHEASFQLPKGMDRDEAKVVITKAVYEKYGQGKTFMMYMPGAIDGVFSATIQIKG